MPMISDENKVIWIGIGLAGLWWILESLIYVVVFHESTFVQQLVHPGSHGLWMRILISLLIIMFSIYAQTIINRLRRAERESKRAARASGLLMRNSNRYSRPQLTGCVWLTGTTTCSVSMKHS